MAFIGAIVGAISSAIAGIASFLGGLGWLGQMVVGVGLNLVSNAMAKKKQKKGSATTENQQSGTRLNISYGGAVQREIGVGLFATAGQEIFTCAFGEANKTLARVIQLSDFPTSGITRILIEDEWCYLHGDNNNADGKGYNITGKHNAYVRVKVYNGFQTSADAFLILGSGGQWTWGHVGFGLTYVIVYIEFDQNEMTNVPQMLFECQGKCYDPRFDSTYGGNGSQRWDNIATWGYSDNPIVQAYNYSRGFYLNGELIVGKGMPVSDLPILRWMEAMNLCDELVGNNEKRYRSGMIFVAGNGVQHKDNLEPIMNACAGALVERVDGDIPLVGVTQPVVATLTDDDLITREALNYTPKRTRSELVNAVHGTYNDPEKLWEAVAYPAQSDANALAADGERHAAQVDFKAVFVANQAARLARAGLRENRYQKTYTMVVRPLWRKLEVGDWIRFKSNRYGEGTYRVVGRSLSPMSRQGARNINLSLQEVGAGMYDDTVLIPELPTNKPAPKPIYQNFPDDFKAIAGQAQSEDKKRKIPVFDLTWRQTTDVTVTGLKIEYWQTSEPNSKLSQIVLGSQTAIRLSGFAPKTSYTFRATVIPDPARSTLWGPEVEAISKEEEVGVDTNQILDELSELNEWGYTGLQSARDRLDYLASIAADAAAAGFLESKSIREEVSVRMGENDALYKRQITVAIDGNKALAARIELVEVTVNDKLAQVIDDIKAEIDEQGNATAESLRALNTQLGDLSSNVTMRMQSVTSAEENWARFVLQLRSGSKEAWKNASLIIETNADRSRFMFDADEFYFINSGRKYLPMSIVNGVLRSNAADIGTVTAGSLNINNRFKVDRSGSVEIIGASGTQRLTITNSLLEVYDNNNRLRVQLGIW